MYCSGRGDCMALAAVSKSSIQHRCVPVRGYSLVAVGIATCSIGIIGIDRRMAFCSGQGAGQLYLGRKRPTEMTGLINGCWVSMTFRACNRSTDAVGFVDVADVNDRAGGIRSLCSCCECSSSRVVAVTFFAAVGGVCSPGG